MYFFNATALRRDLRNGSVTEFQKMLYFLYQSLVVLILTSLPLLGSMHYSFMLVLEIVLSVLITIGGTWWCYRINRNGDNQHFLDRIICLQWPVGIQAILLAFVVFLSLYIVIISMLSPMWAEYFLADQQTYLDVVVVMLALVFFYWRLITHMRWIAMAKN